jgi:deoxyribose-phosphate aldolase
VCVRLNYVPLAVKELEGSRVGVACVVGFHEGTQSFQEKAAEATAAVEAGATELDVVLNRDMLQSGQYANVYRELQALRERVTPAVVFKLILETSQLTTDDVIAASILAGYAGFDFIKTSTGFCGRGASFEDVQLMNRCREYLYSNGIVPSLAGGAGGKMRIKASGGVRSYADAVKMVEAGASRIGTSSGIKIAEEAKQSSGRGHKGESEQTGVVENGGY